MKWFYANSGDSVWKMYLSFDGRLDRLTLWTRIILLNVFTYIVSFTLESLSTEYTWINFGSLFNMVLIVYWFCMTTLWVRRFHDKGVSGRWYGAYAVAVPAAFGLNVWANFHMNGHPMQGALVYAGLGLAALTALAGLYILIRFGFTKSQDGENEYGPEPGTRVKEKPVKHRSPGAHQRRKARRAREDRARRLKEPRGEASEEGAEKKATEKKAEAGEKADE